MLRKLRHFADQLVDRFVPASDVGQHGERIAERFLRDAGYRTLARNWTGRSGELDLIVRCGRVIVFVEVRTRSGPFLDEAIASIGDAKQRQVARVAAEWWHRHRREGLRLRFDVVAVAVDGDAVTVRHVESAFESPL